MKELQKLLNEAGQVTRWPSKPKEKTLVIEYLATKFSTHEDYSERDVNEVLKHWHTFSDWALLRRELFERGLLNRDKNGSSYWRMEKGLEVFNEDVTVTPRRSTAQLFRLEGVGLRSLTYRDVSSIQALYERCQDFFLVLTGETPTLEATKQLFETEPPHAPRNDALYLGLFQKTLVGIVKLDRDYPSEGEWFISLLLLDPSYRNQGLGHAVVAGLESWLKEQGVKQLSLIVVEENRAALRFWQRKGYVVHQELAPKTFGNKTHSSVELIKNLRGD
jgi:RimJ/RimL family protein N-acetyltransferase